MSKITKLVDESGTTYTRSAFMYSPGWHSFERIPMGTVRVIDGVMMKAWSVTGRGPLLKPRIWWAELRPDELPVLSKSTTPRRDGGRGSK